MNGYQTVEPLRFIYHTELRRRGWGLGLQRQGRQFTERWEGHMFGKQIFAMPCHAEKSYVKKVIFGNSSLLGVDSLYKCL